ncbi:hypothetical protein D3C76_1402490 [compost metagenome]
MNVQMSVNVLRLSWFDAGKAPSYHMLYDLEMRFPDDYDEQPDRGMSAYNDY